MSRRIRIVLFGDSLLIGGLGASLKAEGRFEVVHASRPRSGEPDLEVMNADVAIFDVDTPGSTAALSWLESHPDLVLLGVSPDRNVTRVWSAREHRELSVRDLVALIEADSNHVRPEDECRNT